MNEPLSVAPMMDWTHAHWRAYFRGISRKTVLYSEMIVDSTVLHQQTNLDFFLGRQVHEDPSVIQLGGSVPEDLARATEVLGQYGDYSEFNLNCGCPSEKVSTGCFGAKLMLQPELVREIMHQMQRRTDKPVTVKCRIGVDANDSYDELTHFIQTAASGGPRKFIIHARKCLLSGLTTKQNRDIPPLHYEVVHRLKRDFPELSFILNGGLKDFDVCEEHMRPWAFNGEELPALQGCMLGRQAYSDPLMFADADNRFFGEKNPGLTRRQVLDRYMDYCDWVQSGHGPKCIMRGNKGVTRPPKLPATNALTQTMHNLFNGCHNNGRFKVAINDAYVTRRKRYNPTARDVIEEALEKGGISDAVLDAPIGRDGPHGAVDDDTRGGYVLDYHDRERTRDARFNEPSHTSTTNANADAAAATSVAEGGGGKGDGAGHVFRSLEHVEGGVMVD